MVGGTSGHVSRLRIAAVRPDVDWFLAGFQH